MPANSKEHFVVDGLNICHLERPTSLSPLLALLNELLKRGHSFFCAFDASAPHELDKVGQRGIYDDLLKSLPQYFTQKKGKGAKADDLILFEADDANASVISNDYFKQYEGQYAWLRKDRARLVSVDSAGHKFWIDRLGLAGPIPADPRQLALDIKASLMVSNASVTPLTQKQTAPSPQSPSNMSHLIPQDPQLLEGDQQRCACVLLLDTSSSMSGSPIDELNNGLKIFQEELQADPLSRKRVDVAVVSFDSVVTPVQPFINATHFQAPKLTAQGGTEMAGGISKALEFVANRKIEYRAAGIVPYRPWIFMITDGQASGLQAIEAQLRTEEERKGVVFFAVGVQGADMTCLRRLAGNKTFELKGLNFRGLFTWLSASLKKASAGTPGQQQALEKPDNSIII